MQQAYEVLIFLKGTGGIFIFIIVLLVMQTL